ncbi:amidohydrolase family protein [Microbacterium sp. NPDC091313]
MTALPPDDLVPDAAVSRLTGVVLPDGSRVDRVIAEGAFAEPGGAESFGAESFDAPAGVEVDATGWMLLPPAADMHAHIDKAYTWHAAGEPEGSLVDAVASWQRFGHTLDEERIATHARRQLQAALRAGVLTLRTHVNYHEGPDPLRGLRAVLAVREEFRGLVDVQVVAMHSHVRDDGIVREGIAMGADLLGGAPHLGDDPAAEVDRSVRLAEAAGVGLDLHADETLDPHSADLLRIAERTRDWPSHMTRSAGHCVALAVQPPDRLAAILDAAALAGVSIITNPLTNLYLMGWEHPVATPRAVPPLAAIVSAGIELAAGGDNVQDPFNPLGNGDMVDVAAALVLAGHATPREAWRIVAAGRALAGIAPTAGHVGERADGILVRTGSVAQALAERAPDRVVLRGGRVVATRTTRTASVATAPSVRRDAPASPRESEVRA